MAIRKRSKMRYEHGESVMYTTGNFSVVDDTSKPIACKVMIAIRIDGTERYLITSLDNNINLVPWWIFTRHSNNWDLLLKMGVDPKQYEGRKCIWCYKERLSKPIAGVLTKNELIYKLGKEIE